VADRAVITTGPAELTAPWVFRSYDNFSEARNPDKARDSGAAGVWSAPSARNPGPCTRFAAWKVARAATAAPLYFKPLEIALDDGEILSGKKSMTKTTFSRQGSSNLLRNLTNSAPAGPAGQPERATVRLTDGGFGRNNNPGEEVLHELRSMMRSRNKKIGTWVSIGTGRARETADRNRPNMVGTVMQSFARVGDTEAVHEMLQEESQRDNFKFRYFRLNEASSLDSIEMDEWKPSGSSEDSGRETLKKIDDAFNSWAGNVENVKRFQKCARALVMARRNRCKDISRWERYALGKFYVCRRNDCIYDPDELWHYRNTFRNHLREDHNIQDDEEMEDTMSRGEYYWEYKAPIS
jgi:hypothetical protein